MEELEDMEELENVEELVKEGKTSTDLLVRSSVVMATEQGEHLVFVGGGLVAPGARFPSPIFDGLPMLSLGWRPRFLAVG